MIDSLDAQILHALQLSPRVSFRRIAAVVAVPEQTVARRYHKLRRDGVVRVVGLVNPRVHGDAQWVARIRTKPDRIPQLAEALIRRTDVAHASFLSGWTELVCVINAPLDADREDLLLQRLSRTASVLDINIDLLLHTFGQPASEPWTGYGHKLSSEQADQILADSADRECTGELIHPTVEDRPVLDALAEDGRAPHSLLAQRAGWSVARAGRRIAALETSGTLFYDVDLLGERLGYHLNAMLWLTVAPEDTRRVGEQLAAHDQIAFAGAISGPKNLMAIAICRDADDLYHYLTDVLATINGILSYDVSIRTQSLKYSGSLVAHGRLLNPNPTPARAK